MKRSCKNIDITNWEVIYPWVLECIKRHKKRYDFRKMLIRIGGLTREERDAAAVTGGDADLLAQAAVNIAKEAAKRIAERELKLSPCHIREKQDHSTLKLRMIGKECAMQQVLDYIAVRSCEDIWKRRIVPQQSSSIRGRGQVYGTVMISKWLESDDKVAKHAAKHGLKYTRKCKYYTKLDVTKCYQSMRVDRFMEKFRRDCGNEDILWLWETLLRSHRVPLPAGTVNEGFMIGALPSQMAAQYMLSFLYRHIMDMHYKQRKLISHMELFMDDIYMTGHTYKSVRLAAEEAAQYAKEELGLTIKPNWQILRTEESPVDMMGYVIHADGNITLRPRVFIKARRMILRVKRKGISLRQARRISSYKGYFWQRDRWMKSHLKQHKVICRLDMQKHFSSAAHIVSISERRKDHAGGVQQETGTDSIYVAA